MRTLPALLILVSASLTAIAADDHSAAIEERQAAFDEIKTSMKTIKENLKAEDPTAVRAAASKVLENANRVTELFPEGSYEGDTRAKKKIWEKREDFDARQQELVKHATALVAAAQGDDPKLLKDAFKTTSKDCKGCHMKYRQLL